MRAASANQSAASSSRPLVSDRLPRESAQSAAPFRAVARTELSCDRRRTARYWNIACPHPAVCWRSRACSASRESTAS